MSEEGAAEGLTQFEPLLWEKGRKGRCGYSHPPQDVEPCEPDPAFVGPGPDIPDVSEIEIVRHYTRLSQWNYGVDSGFYPLGSCTMKYNPKSNERQARLKGFAAAHPLLPEALCQGGLRMMHELEGLLAAITGMDAVTLQPAAGAHGELCGMLIFHAYHARKGRPRSKILVPDTAHGTNPASAALCGFRAVPIPSNENGIISPESVAERMDEETAGIMITNPNTLGLFEEHITRIAEIVHSRGGLVYGDCANMNAVMGIVDMGRIGVDVLHLNLHKTFSTPHGGGGPVGGPVCVKAHLEPFLPVPRIRKVDGRYELSDDFPLSIGRLHSFYGSFAVMVRAYSYILSMGGPNLKKASELAVLNANYLKERLRGTLHLAYDRPCMHECVFSDKYQRPYGVTTLDMAKRLLDFGIHPPTIYFPLVVSGAIMIEPTETEPKEEIDRFVETIERIVEEAKKDPTLLQTAPHRCKVRRLDETGAARRPVLTG